VLSHVYSAAVIDVHGKRENSGMRWASRVLPLRYIYFANTFSQDSPRILMNSVTLCPFFKAGMQCRLIYSRFFFGKLSLFLFLFSPSFPLPSNLLPRSLISPLHVTSFAMSRFLVPGIPSMPLAFPFRENHVQGAYHSFAPRLQPCLPPV
jgi:hypothetical protein